MCEMWKLALDQQEERFLKNHGSTRRSNMKSDHRNKVVSRWTEGQDERNHEMNSSDFYDQFLYMWSRPGRTWMQLFFFGSVIHVSRQVGGFNCHFIRI